MDFTLSSPPWVVAVFQVLAGNWTLVVATISLIFLFREGYLLYRARRSITGKPVPSPEEPQDDFGVREKHQSKLELTLRSTSLSFLSLAYSKKEDRTYVALFLEQVGVFNPDSQAAHLDRLWLEVTGIGFNSDNEDEIAGNRAIGAVRLKTYSFQTTGFCDGKVGPHEFQKRARICAEAHGVGSDCQELPANLKLINEGSGAVTDDSPRIGLEWAATQQPDELYIRLANHEDSPVAHCKTSVVDLAYWDAGARRFLRDYEEPIDVRITGDATVTPEILNPKVYLLVKHYGTPKFRLESSRSPSKEVARSTPGIWQIVVRVEDAEERWRAPEKHLFFSWNPSNRPQLQVEDDPES